MSFEGHREVRATVRQLRRAPGRHTRLRIPFDHDRRLPEHADPGPLELALSVTDSDGAIADWFDDEWWTALLQRWAAAPVTIHIESTPGALLHPVTLHYLDMIRRVAPRWRVVGQAFADDVTSDEEVSLLAGSGYHEVRFDGKLRAPRRDPDRPVLPEPLERLFARIRSAQNRLRTSTPVLVRLPARGQPGAPRVQRASEPGGATIAST